MYKLHRGASRAAVLHVMMKNKQGHRTARCLKRGMQDERGFSLQRKTYQHLPRSHVPTNKALPTTQVRGGGTDAKMC